MILFWLLLPAMAAALEGDYVQGCRASAVRAEQFSGGSAVYRETNFLDEDCATASLSSRSYGEVVLGPPSPGFQEIDFVFTRVTLTIHDPGTLAYYRSHQVCGRGDWEMEREVEVTGALCEFYGAGVPAQVPRAGDRRFGIIQIREGEIYLGALSPERDGLTPDRRPQVLDPDAYRFVRFLNTRAH